MSESTTGSSSAPSDSNLNPYRAFHASLKASNRKPDTDEVLDVFIEGCAARNLSLYPAQEEAILELYDGANVILKTPTGSGKSLVAAAAQFYGLCLGKRSIYTCPIKALVNEKFLDLCEQFGPENVGISTGDASVNPEAPILCCTAEVLANLALREGDRMRIDSVIMDEFHYYSDPDRGMAWQVPLLTLPQAQFLLISATLGNTRFFEERIESFTGRRCSAVESSERPVPLTFSYTEDGMEEILQSLKEEQKLPVYIVHFTQRSTVETAQSLTSINFSTKEEKREMGIVLSKHRFDSPFGKELKKFLRMGIGVHHAGMLPKYRLLVERLAQENRLKVICGTDTLGVGVNVPIRTALFTGLAKFDGKKMGILKVRDFQQIAGRAGRRGFDDQGWVVSMAPPHVIENKKAEKRLKENPGKKKKVTLKQPLKGEVTWNEQHFNRLIESSPEPLVSSFKVNHGVVLNVLGRESDGCRALRNIIRTCHETDHQKHLLGRRAWQLFRSLVDKDIVEILDRPEPNGQKLRLHVDLQEDFSLNHALSLFLVDTVKEHSETEQMDALVVLSLVEGVLENPGTVLRKQVDKLKDALFRELKAQGVEFEDRMERLEQVEHPKPEREFIYSTFNAFSEKHPWVGEDNIQPKSIAREMFEKHMSFQEYVKAYALSRAEGVLLRHLNNTYKTLQQSVPEAYWSEELMDIMVFLETILKTVDSSMLDEWQNLREQQPESEETVKLPAPKSFLRFDPERDFEVVHRQLRNAIFLFVRQLAQQDYGNGVETLESFAGVAGLDEVDQKERWSAHQLQSELEPYFEAYESIRMDPAARAKDKSILLKDETGEGWKLFQILTDTDESNEWQLVFRYDPVASQEFGEYRLEFEGLEKV